MAIVNFGVRSSFGLFTAPISEAHGWPREIFSFAMAMQNLLWGIATPIAGMLADRYGSARVLMAGAVFYAIGTLMMALTDTPVMFNIGGGILVGIGVALSSFGIVMAALGRIVPPERRSWAFGIATAVGLPRPVHLRAADRGPDRRLWLAECASRPGGLHAAHHRLRAAADGAEHDPPAGRSRARPT